MISKNLLFLQVTSCVFGFLTACLFLNPSLDAGMYLALRYNIPWQVGYFMAMLPILVMIAMMGAEYGHFWICRWFNLKSQSFWIGLLG